MSRQATAAMIAAALIGAALPVRAEPAKDAETRAAPPAASRPATTRPAKRVADFIAQVRQAAHPREAITAYARGCAVDRLNVELHNAHMRRMLQFGQPQLAYFPAQTLVRIQPENGTAWGVLGYLQGTNGKLAEALEASIRAGRIAGGDPSILNNVGQLIAWYQGQRKPPKLSDANMRLIERLKKDLGEREPFVDAYARVSAAYARRDEEAAKVESKITIVEAEGQAARQEAEEVDRKLRDLNDEIKLSKRNLGRLKGELYSRELAADDSVTGWRRRAMLRGRIRDMQRSLDELETRSRQALREGQAAVEKMRGKSGELSNLRRQLEQVLASVEPSFRWDPPAVDGVVTPVADRIPPPKTTTAPRTPESTADKRLEMAKLYLANALTEKAVEILRGIVADYGATPAAARAKALLKELAPAATQPKS